MLNRCRFLLALLPLLAFAFDTTARASAATRLTLLQSIDIESRSGSVAQLAVDVRRGRLYVPLRDDARVLIVSLRLGTVADSFSTRAHPQGIGVDPATGHIVVACADRGSVTLYDPDSLSPIGAAQLGNEAGTVLVEPVRNAALIAYNEAQSGHLALVDLDTGEVKDRMDTPAHIAGFDAATGRAFAAMPSQRSMAVVNVDQAKLLTTWPLTGVRGNDHAALDDPDHRLFASCLTPPRLAVVDSGTGFELPQVEVDAEPGTISVDPASGVIYVACGAGQIDIVRPINETHNRYEVAGRVASAPGARTALLAPDLHRLFVIAPKHGDTAAKLMIFQLESPGR